MLSRQTYILVANAIKNAETKSDIAATLASAFKRDNPRFDRQRFYDACGLDDPAWSKSPEYMRQFAK